MNQRAGTASADLSSGARTTSTARLVGWAVLVALLIAIAYASRAGSAKPDPQVLYKWSTAIASLVQDGVILAFVLALARGRWALLALRRPAGLRRTLAILGGALVAVYVWEGLYSAIAHPGNEQGLTPSHWEPKHAAAYVVNGIVICTFIPFVEELTFRGLGYSLLERFGRWPAILAIGVLFGLAHGLLVSLPVIVLLGWVLGWIRARTGSVLPGMALHGTFNLIALLAAVTIHN